MQPQVLLELLVYVLLAIVITGLGLLAELQSALYLMSGETTVALWLAGMGLLCLYAGIYLIGYEKLLPAVRQV